LVAVAALLDAELEQVLVAGKYVDSKIQHALGAG
jgi:hypothetical protein